MPFFEIQPPSPTGNNYAFLREVWRVLKGAYTTLTHGALSGRDAENQHPTSAILANTAGFYRNLFGVVSGDLQTVISALDALPAVRLNKTSEISSLSAKTPVAADVILGEDSEGGFAKKKFTRDGLYPKDAAHVTTLDGGDLITIISSADNNIYLIRWDDMAFTFPRRPTPLAKTIAALPLQNQLPSAAGDGSYIVLPPTTSGDISLYDKEGVVVWTKAITDVNAGCDLWSAIHLDPTNNRLYVWAYDTGTEPDTYYLAYMALADGAVTNLGTCQPGDGLLQQCTYVSRDTPGAGDFYFRDGDYGITISSADGSIVTAAAKITQNSCVVQQSTGYQTADGSILVASVTAAVTSTGGLITLQRGGAYGRASLPVEHGIAFMPLLWGDYVACAGFGSTSTMYAPQYFSRVDFDAWLVSIATDVLGLPG